MARDQDAFKNGYNHSTVWFAWSETSHPFVSHVPEQFIRVVRTNSILWSGPIKFLGPDQLTFSGPGREVFGPHHYCLVRTVVFWSRPVAVLVGPFSGWDQLNVSFGNLDRSAPAQRIC